MRQHAVRDRGGQRRLTLLDPAQVADQEIDVLVLEQIAARAGRDRFEQMCVVVIDRGDDRQGVRWWRRLNRVWDAVVSST